MAQTDTISANYITTCYSLWVMYSSDSALNLLKVLTVLVVVYDLQIILQTQKIKKITKKSRQSHFSCISPRKTYEKNRYHQLDESILTGQIMQHAAFHSILPRWLKASRYSDITGYSLPALRKKRQNAVWLEGIHWQRGPDGNVYYDWRRIDDWVENGC